MKIICSSCQKEFTKIKSSKDDGLCGKCRSSKNYLANVDSYRKTKTCPICGKTILKNSNYCGSCSQYGEKNRMYKDGSKASTRVCSKCGSKISTGSIKGLCRTCYFIERKENCNRIYSLDQYKIWRTSVFEKFNYTCCMCGKHGYMNAHHIYPKRDFPEKVFDINNGITLCSSCHEKTYGKEYEYIDYFTKIIAELKLREHGEPWNGNAVPSPLWEGVETRGEIKSSKSAGQPLRNQEEDIVRAYGKNNRKKSKIKNFDDNRLMIIDNAQGIYVLDNVTT